MFGRLVATASGIGAVIAVEQILRKSQVLYDLIMGGVLTPDRLLLIWICLLPVIFYHAGPEIVSIAVAWRYHQWTEDNEIVVLRSAGQSCTRIAGPGMLTAVVGCLFCAVNSIFLMPPSWSKIEDIHSAAVASINTNLLQPGRAQQLAPGISLMFSSRGNDGETLEDVLISNNGAEISARHARVVRSGGNDSLQLANGAYLLHDESGFNQVAFGSLLLPLRIAPTGAAPARSPGSFEQPIMRLLFPPVEIRQNPTFRASWQTEGNRRIINPLLCIGNTVLVLGLLIPKRQTRLRRRALFGVAIASGVATNALPDVLISMGIGNPGLLPLLYLLPLMTLLAGSLLLLHADRAPARLIPWRSRRRTEPLAGIARQS